MAGIASAKFMRDESSLEAFKFNDACRNHGITYASIMKTIPVTTARSDFYRLIDSTISSHEPIQITAKRGNAVLLAEEDWRAIQETLYLKSIPGMHDSIRKGMTEPVETCGREIDL